MSPRGLLGPAVRRRIGMIAFAVVLMAGAVVLLDTARARTADDAAAAAVLLNVMDAPIPWEADVFRLHPDDLAMGLEHDPRRTARARTLAGFRGLRAYPGAPPRIPHSLSPEEFRTMTCNTCHESGGYSARFGAYAPVTPHPEFRNCLQCHAADDGSVGVAVQGRLFGGEAHDVRSQRSSAADFVALDWKTTDWPAINRRALHGSPPTIPHTLEMRGNCLACHAGSSAVAEIRTTHPERANCRQCHVPAYDVEDPVFTRSAGGASGATGGVR
jgi:nitrate reductase (cytochrome), electron transfer subunit